MPIVILKFKEKILGEFRIETGPPLTIGRKAENDVVIENLAVSGYHAKIEALGDAFFLTDLQSTNGSFINESKITSHQLAHGDIITIGKHALVFTYEEGEARPGITNNMDQTMVIDTNQHRAMLEKNKTRAAVRENKIAALTMLAGGSGDVGISKKLFKIGKSPQSDIQITGFLVGQTAAAISQRPDGYYLSYVEGFFKPRVNGKAIKDTVLLKEFDLIECGKTKMQLTFKPKTKKK